MRTFKALFVLMLVVWLPASPASAVSLDWVTVGSSGNAGDPQQSCSGCGPGTTFGAVAYEYAIGKYEVTNAQYAEFLNAVADTDTYSLFDSGMTLNPFGGITQSGLSGSYTYSTIVGRENMPVIYVSFYDSLRFANWLHNGQPTGAQDSTTTEDGAYTFSGLSSVGARNAGATVFLPNEDEWYKAAYFDTASSGYYSYPAGMDAVMTCANPVPTANTANCNYVVSELTNVGSYIGSASPNGTFDQGGNVEEYTETILIATYIAMRGGRLNGLPSEMAADGRRTGSPTLGGSTVGFRVASTAVAPAVPSLGSLGIVILSSVMGLATLRRLHA